MDTETPLRKFRRAQEPRVNLRDLAAKIGVSEGQMSRIEREGTTSLPIAMKLAEITQLPVEAFAQRSEAA